MKIKILLAYILVISGILMSFVLYDHHNRSFIQSEILSIKTKILEDMHQMSHNKSSNKISAYEAEKFKELLTQNGETILKIIAEHQTNLDKQKETKAQHQKNMHNLYDQAHDPFAGTKDANIRIAQFVDYTCPYCHGTLETVSTLIKKNPNIKIIFKPLTLLGEQSSIAAKFAIAVNIIAPDLYMNFHQRVMQDAQYTTTHLTKICKEIGVNIKELSDLFKNKEQNNKINNIIKDNIKLATNLQIKGTPVFVIEGEKISGAASYKMLQDFIDNKKQAKTINTSAKMKKAIPTETDTPDLRNVVDENTEEAPDDAIEISGSASISVNQKKDNIFSSSIQEEDEEDFDMLQK